MENSYAEIKKLSLEETYIKYYELLCELGELSLNTMTFDEYYDQSSLKKNYDKKCSEVENLRKKPKSAYSKLYDDREDIKDKLTIFILISIMFTIFGLPMYLVFADENPGAIIYFIIMWAIDLSPYWVSYLKYVFINKPAEDKELKIYSKNKTIAEDKLKQANKELESGKERLKIEYNNLYGSKNKKVEDFKSEHLYTMFLLVGILSENGFTEIPSFRGYEYDEMYNLIKNHRVDTLKQAYNLILQNRYEKKRREEMEREEIHYLWEQETKERKLQEERERKAQRYKDACQNELFYKNKTGFVGELGRDMARLAKEEALADLLK